MKNSGKIQTIYTNGKLHDKVGVIYSNYIWVASGKIWSKYKKTNANQACIEIQTIMLDSAIFC